MRVGTRFPNAEGGGLIFTGETLNRGGHAFALIKTDSVSSNIPSASTPFSSSQCPSFKVQFCINLTFGKMFSFLIALTFVIVCVFENDQIQRKREKSLNSAQKISTKTSCYTENTFAKPD